MQHSSWPVIEMPLITALCIQLVTLYRQTQSYFLNNYSYTINPSSLVTLYRQTWSSFPNRSVLHHAGKHGHPFPTDLSYIINPSSLATVCRQTRSCLPKRSVVHYKSFLATLCRQTQSCFPKMSVLHIKSFISGHIMPANMAVLPQQINPVL